MNRLDFLSKSPNTLIFGQKSSKTNLGGVLTVIYLIIVIIIAVTYLFDYGVNNKYSVLYISENEFISDEQALERINNEKLNPEISFNLNLTMGNISNFYLIKLDPFTLNLSVEELKGEHKAKPLNIFYGIMYKCPGNYTNCTLREEDKPISLNSFNIILNYTGFKVDHQSDIPLQKTYMQEEFLFSFNNEIKINVLKWKTIKYIEEKGLFGTFEKNILGKSNELYGGQFVSYQNLDFNREEMFLKREKEYNAKLLYLFGVYNLNEKITDTYTRKKKEYLILYHLYVLYL